MEIDGMKWYLAVTSAYFNDQQIWYHNSGFTSFKITMLIQI